VTLPSSGAGGGARENVTAERSRKGSLYSSDPRLWPRHLGSHEACAERWRALELRMGSSTDGGSVAERPCSTHDRT
jgi:hypothetical protein